MGKKTQLRFELNEDEVGEFLRSAELGQELRYFGDHVADKATGNAVAAGQADAKYTVKNFRGHDRQRVHVGTANKAAHAAEIAQRALTRATGGRLQ